MPRRGRQGGCRCRVSAPVDFWLGLVWVCWLVVGGSPYTRGMTTLADYIEAGKALAVAERLEAAHQLLLSVDADDDTSQVEIAAAWDEVIGRRVEEIVTGEAKLVDGRDAHARVRAEIAATRK